MQPRHTVVVVSQDLLGELVVGTIIIFWMELTCVAKEETVGKFQGLKLRHKESYEIASKWTKTMRSQSGPTWQNIC